MKETINPVTLQAVQEDKVSLITPMYNAMPYLKDYLQSVLDQDYRPLELILSDDGSTDGSLEYAKSFSTRLTENGVKVIILEREHHGQSYQTNEALKHISGAYFTWCDADDLLTPHSISRKVSYLKDHPEVGIVRSDGLRIETSTQTVTNNYAWKDEQRTMDLFDSMLLDTTYCYAGCYMMRTSLLLEGYPDLEIPLSAEEQNLQLLLPPLSRSLCGFIPEYLHHYNKHDGSHSRTKRSFSVTSRRMDNFIRLKRDILPHCQVDQDHYNKVLDELQETYRRRILESTLAACRKNIKTGRTS